MADLRRWTDRHHQEWVCGAYDHGPMCRLCRRVDPTLALVLENLDKGFVEYVNVDQNGEPQFRVTPGGQRRIDELLAHNDGSLAGGEGSSQRSPALGQGQHSDAWATDPRNPDAECYRTHSDGQADG